MARRHAWLLTTFIWSSCLQNRFRCRLISDDHSHLYLDVILPHWSAVPQGSPLLNCILCVVVARASVSSIDFLGLQSIKYLCIGAPGVNSSTIQYYLVLDWECRFWCLRTLISSSGTAVILWPVLQPHCVGRWFCHHRLSRCLESSVPQSLS